MMHLIEAAGCIVSEIRYSRRCPLPQNIFLVLALEVLVVPALSLLRTEISLDVARSIAGPIC